MGDGLKLCVKPNGVDLDTYPRQFHESCSVNQSCSAHGLICQQFEDDYSECVIDSSPGPLPTTEAPITTQAPVTTKSPATTQAPTTQTPTTQKPETSPSGESKCHVCYYNCQDINNWLTRSGAWENEKESHCRQVTGNSSCFCYVPGTDKDCYDSFSQKSGISCGRRLADLII